MEAHGFCDVDYVSCNSGNFNTIYMLGSLAKIFETNQLAEYRYFRFQTLSTMVMPFQAPWKVSIWIHYLSIWIHFLIDDWMSLFAQGLCIVF
ncbi:MAG: hypothetical protein NPIRA03_20790 [Nitrospirales bacterium]|nr:MAG: hypothetical protein NPIRA03_20790 [Nitrospirales bacterium]